MFGEHLDSSLGDVVRPVARGTPVRCHPVFDEISAESRGRCVDDDVRDALFGTGVDDQTRFLGISHRLCKHLHSVRYAKEINVYDISKVERIFQTAALL